MNESRKIKVFEEICEEFLKALDSSDPKDMTLVNLNTKIKGILIKHWAEEEREDK